VKRPIPSPAARVPCDHLEGWAGRRKERPASSPVIQHVGGRLRFSVEFVLTRRWSGPLHDRNMFGDQSFGRLAIARSGPPAVWGSIATIAPFLHPIEPLSSAGPLQFPDPSGEGLRSFPDRASLSPSTRCHLPWPHSTSKLLTAPLIHAGGLNTRPLQALLADLPVPDPGSPRGPAAVFLLDVLVF